MSCAAKLSQVFFQPPTFFIISLCYCKCLVEDEVDNIGCRQGTRDQFSRFICSLFNVALSGTVHGTLPHSRSDG